MRNIGGKNMKNKKRGLTYIEIAITVAMLAMLTTIIGPILRYYLKLSNNYSTGLFEKIELDGTYRKLEEILGSISLDDKWGNLTTGTKNAGIAVRDNFSPTLNIKLGTFQGNLMSSNGSSVKGNTLYVLVPIYHNGTLRQSFHTFRFMNISGQTGLYYTSSVEDDGSVKLLTKQNEVPFKKEELYLPSGAGIQELVPNTTGASNRNYFTEIGGGIYMHIEYYKDPAKTVAKDDPSNIITVEKLFLKRGEI